MTSASQRYCVDLECFYFAVLDSSYCSTHTKGSSTFLSSILGFSKGNLKPATTVVRTVADLYKAQENLEAVGWRTFQDFTVAGTEEPKADVAFSARFVAAVRAIETESDMPLFHDPFALSLAGREAVERVKVMMKQDAEEVAKMNDATRPYWCPLRPYLLIRTRFIDDAIDEHLKNASSSLNNITHESLPHWQLVILGSGMDSRAWRIAWPTTRTTTVKCFEIDRPDVIAMKEILARDFISLSKNNVTVKYLSADLSVAGACTSALISAGFVPSSPTIWLIEGLLYYLAPTHVDTLLSEVQSLSAPGSALITDVVNEAERTAVSFRSSVDYPEHFFGRFGFKTKRVLQPGDEGANYNRFLRPFPPRSLPLEPSSCEPDSVRRSYLIAAEMS